MDVTALVELNLGRIAELKRPCSKNGAPNIKAVRAALIPGGSSYEDVGNGTRVYFVPSALLEDETHILPCKHLNQ